MSWQQMAHSFHILWITNQTLLFAGLLDVLMFTAAAAGQLHGGHDDGARFVHVDDWHHFLGGWMTTWHLNKKEPKSNYKHGLSKLSHFNKRCA